MTKSFFVAALCLMLFNSASAQTSNDFSPKDIFNSESIVWYGMDYSHARMAGFDRMKIEELMGYYVLGFSKLSHYNRELFNPESVFGKFKCPSEVDVVEKRNYKIDIDTLRSAIPNNLNNTKIGQIISEYGGGRFKEGVGAVFVIDYFNYDKDEVALYVTFFDIHNLKLLFTQRIINEAGTNKYYDRNKKTKKTDYLHWYGAIMTIGDLIAQEKLSEWKKEIMQQH